jgi:hypothetical protein
VVTVYLSHDLLGADGSPLRSAGYSWQFRVRAGEAALEYEQIASMTTRTDPNISTRSYGGIGSDLNHDGALDLTVVNEDSQDLRVFLNLNDGSGLYQPFLQPTFPVGDRASPSEPSDFNRDGHVDICVANIDAATVSVLLGHGDGTFAPQQTIAVGNAPRGICTLDADGDGDTDIVNTNASSANMSLLLNDGAGVFGPPTFFQGGAANEWALAAADMTSDGVLDLVVGGRVDQKIFIRAGNGDGTFSAAGNQNCGGLVWMIDVGDVDGDGDADVACANSNTNNGSILRGDGAGNLAPAQTYPTDAFPLATDLGDLDGDGDLDWELSSFNGDWRLFANNGAGTYAFNQEFDAPAAASCAVMLDLDNDRDLDLALIDEIADVVVLQKNISSPPPDLVGDLNGDDIVDGADLGILLLLWGHKGITVADLDASGLVDGADLGILLLNWTG